MQKILSNSFHIIFTFLFFCAFRSIQGPNLGYSTVFPQKKCPEVGLSFLIFLFSSDFLFDPPGRISEKGVGFFLLSSSYFFLFPGTLPLTFWLLTERKTGKKRIYPSLFPVFSFIRLFFLSVNGYKAAILPVYPVRDGFVYQCCAP